MEIEARIVRLQLAETFVIARDATDHSDVVHVALSHKGTTGYGEAAPIERYRESAESAARFVESHGELASLIASEVARLVPLIEEIGRASADRSPRLAT